jgi:CheY-like chemotaxis protein
MNGETMEILLVEDNPEDVRLTEEALIDTGLSSHMRTVANGEEALDFLKKKGEYSQEARPDVVLLDLNMPRKNGHAVLSEMRQHPEWDEIPVIVLTVSKHEEEIASAMETRMNYYMCKPVDPEKLLEVLSAISQTWH